MTENEILARRVLEKRRLTEDQVAQLLDEARRTGRSFREIALGRGMLSAQDFQIVPPKQLPTSTVLLIFAGLMVFMGLVLFATNYYQKRTHARDALVKSRISLHASPGNPRVWTSALAGYDTYVEVFPGDPDVLRERERIQQYLKDYTIAIADMELEARLSPARAELLKTQITQLRELKARSGK
jgi:hypothetical protein